MTSENQQHAFGQNRCRTQSNKGAGDIHQPVLAYPIPYHRHVASVEITVTNGKKPLHNKS